VANVVPSEKHEDKVIFGLCAHFGIETLALTKATYIVISTLNKTKMDTNKICAL
jgi:hypothetical protein